MTRIRRYHRPATIEEALELLARSEVTTAPLGGGTVLNGRPESLPEEVVDLQSLGLNSIDRDGPALRFGATALLQDVVDHEWTPPVLRDLAHGEAPNTFRNAATVGGTVGSADPESRFLAGLVAYGAVATLATSQGDERIAVGELLEDRTELDGKIITGVEIDVSGQGAAAGTARTPADTPIVLVVGRRLEDGQVNLAATGLAPVPITIDLDRISDLDPPGDFRGTPEYRRHLASVLGARVMSELEGSAS
ncbi:MAG: hypothetical protein GY720_03585 [bacterium]|nr:hypothetical protein [bacterium]